MSVGRVLVYGGKGALGSKCIEHFKASYYWVVSIDLEENPKADLNIVLGKDDPVTQQEVQVFHTLGAALKDEKLDAIICVAGGSTGGNAQLQLVATTELMWRQNVSTSLIASAVASEYLKEGGILILRGALAALEGTPGMMGYGAAKAAVHQLTRSLAGKNINSGLPEDATAVAILPLTLDTPKNRKLVPTVDFTTCTPLEFVADLLLKWTKNCDRPPNGSLVQLVTKNSITTTMLASDWI